MQIHLLHSDLVKKWIPLFRSEFRMKSLRVRRRYDQERLLIDATAAFTIGSHNPTYAHPTLATRILDFKQIVLGQSLAAAWSRN
jgi:hypothetical protein